MIRMVTWHTMFWLVFLMGVVLDSLLSPLGGLLVASWWVEVGQKAGQLMWQATRRPGVHRQGWRGVVWASCWGGGGILVGLSWWLWARIEIDRKSCKFC